MIFVQNDDFCPVHHYKKLSLNALRYNIRIEAMLFGMHRLKKLKNKEE